MIVATVENNSWCVVCYSVCGHSPVTHHVDPSDTDDCSDNWKQQLVRSVLQCVGYSPVTHHVDPSDIDDCMIIGNNSWCVVCYSVLGTLL